MAEKEKNDDYADDNFDVSGATTEKAGSIQAIDRGSVHRICSGQVVLTLAIAVKELVENSVDAKATSVDVKLKEYGSEVIEVIDNGTGVEEKDFEGLTLKHHTSKIQDFSDLVGVETFGFRGEALSSLCALSNLSVITCHKMAAVGSKLEFDHHGKMTSKTPCPRQQGTTVVLQNLFSTLPVRYREFQRNLKKEYTKMVQVLNAYCLVTTGVRITCTNQVGKGSRSTVVSTKGNSTLRENIANIFGPKCLQSLLEFCQYDPTEEVCSWFNVKPQSNTQNLFRIEGFISKCEHGQGRSSSDRQYIFINSRPCDSAKLTKLINEVYHSYNRHQYPFIVLTITMDRDSVDVNVTPDKRQIFLQGEKLLLATLKTSLVKMFEPTTSVLKINSFLTFSSKVSKEEDSSDTGSESSSQEVPGPKLMNRGKAALGSTLSKLKRSFSSAFAKDEGTGSPQCSSPESKQMKLEKLQTLSKCQSLPSKFPSENSPSSLTKFLSKQSKSADFVVPTSPSSLSPLSQTSDNFDSKDSCRGDNSRCEEYNSERDNSACETPDSLSLSPALKSNHEEKFLSPRNVERTCKVDSFLSNLKHKLSGAVAGSSNSSPEVILVSGSAQSSTAASSQESRDSDVCIVPNVEPENRNVSEVTEGDSRRLDSGESKAGQLLSDIGGTVEQPPSVSVQSDIDDPGAGDAEDEASVWAKPGGSEDKSFCQLPLLEYDEKEDIQKKEQCIPFSFSEFKARQQCLNKKTKEDESKASFCRSFRAQITPGDSQSAEDELQREIKKDMFPKMEIVGQFNLGFILAKYKDDLFIVDQHATDEKYNFEMLQRHTVIQSQKLIHPQNLELTASNETILIDNLEIFKKNGFDFIIDEKAPPTQRVKLVSTPVSKNWNFGKEDIEELIFMLTDSPGVMCRPSRVRMMFASRACRKAIMIGTALNKAEMRKLLCHMGEIEQPWNCPHGRPTMRHLFNLNMLPK